MRIVAFFILLSQIILFFNSTMKTNDESHAVEDVIVLIYGFAMLASLLYLFVS